MSSHRILVGLALASAAAGIIVACSSDPGAGDATANDAATSEGSPSGVDGRGPEADGATDSAASDGDAGACTKPTGDAAVVDFAVPPLDGGSRPLRIARGPDGNIWFTSDNAPYLVRTNELGTMTTVPLPAQSSPANGLTVGPDGALWFTEPAAGKIGRVAQDGGIAEFPLPNSDGGPVAPVEITTGPEGNLWISLYGDSVARMTPAGVATEFYVGVDGGTLLPSVLAAGPDGNVWFASANLPLISRITTAGAVTHYSVSGRSFGITVGPDGAVWFTMQQKLGRITFGPDPTITEFDVAGVMPAAILSGPDCTSLYITDVAGNRVRRFTPPPLDAGADAALSFVDFSMPTPSADVESLAIGAAGSVWFVEVGASRVGFIQP